MGPKLAEGRDSEIFEHGPGRVLRRARDGRSLVREADVMRHVRAHGYPAPEVFDAGEGWLVMERLDGTDMLAAMRKTPGAVRAAARQLADLHIRLGAIPAPEWLDAAPGPPGDRVVHLDLHPLNVMSTPAASSSSTGRTPGAAIPRATSRTRGRSSPARNHRVDGSIARWSRSREVCSCARFSRRSIASRRNAPCRP